MATDEPRSSKTPRSKKSATQTAEVDEAARARIETELRNHLAGREPEFASAVLARVLGTTVTAEKKPVDAWFEAASRGLVDERSLDQRVESLSEIGKVSLALLARHPWWSRNALVQAIALARSPEVGDDASVGRSISEVLSRWPVLVRTHSWTRTEELSLFEPLAARLRPLLEGTLAIGRATLTPALPPVGLGRTLLALALFPGLVAQRRPRLTRSGELHAADATKLERALGEARGLFATWDSLGAFEEVDGALAPIAPRVKRLLDDPGGLVAEFLKQRLGDLGWALASLVAQAESGERLELGASLLAVGVRTNFSFGFDVPSLAARVERDDLRFAPLLYVDTASDAIALPPDVRAAILGQQLAMGPAAVGYVQPNYEVVLPPGVPLSAAFVIGCAAELVHVEAVARLKLTRESVLAARSVGLDVEDVIQALETLSGPRGLPPAVKHAIEEWGAAVGEARIRTAVVLDLRAAPALLEKVAEKLAPIIVDRPTPRLFILSRAPSPKELAVLRAAGILTRAVAAAGGKPHDSHEEAVVDPPAGPWPLAPRARPRDLRDALDPHRVLDLVEASRPGKKGGASPPSTRGAIDPDDGGEKPLGAGVEEALEEKRTEWGARADWLRALRQIVDSPPFRRAAATAAGAVLLAIRRATEPQRLQLEVARIVAESSVRRAID